MKPGKWKLTDFLTRIAYYFLCSQTASSPRKRMRLEGTPQTPTSVPPQSASTPTSRSTTCLICRGSNRSKRVGRNTTRKYESLSKAVSSLKEGMMSCANIVHKSLISTFTYSAIHHICWNRGWVLMDSVLLTPCLLQQYWKKSKTKLYKELNALNIVSNIIKIRNHSPVTATHWQPLIALNFFTNFYYLLKGALESAAQKKGDIRILTAISRDSMEELHYHASCYNAYCFDSDYKQKR